MKKIIVAMSGGVDSSVAAALLQDQGFAVEGVFMKNWSPETLQSLTDCPWEQDQADAAAVCQQLGIPFRSINFEREYKERVVDYFLAEYSAGRTPNPDIMCNKEIKFKIFLEMAEKAGADFIATGHYAQVREQENEVQLLRGIDRQKDQSYFLYTLNQSQLRRTIFPLGQLKKSEVRKLAEDYSLPTAQKKDSQGICFIGQIDLKKFLMTEIKAQTGLTYLLPPFQKREFWNERLSSAVLIGQHPGVMFYTSGERAGAIVDNARFRHLRNNQDVPPTYVLEKVVEENKIFVTDDFDDPDFYYSEVELEDWQGPVSQPPLLAAPGSLSCQIRYQQSTPSLVEKVELKEGKYHISFINKVKAAAVGQSAVLYQGEQLIGGGIISGVVR